MIINFITITIPGYIIYTKAYYKPINKIYYYSNTSFSGLARRAIGK